MIKKFISAILLFVFFTLLFGICYPFVSTLVANRIFSASSEGSLIKKDDKILGSKLIGQNFSNPKYLWSRPSATAPNPYNAAASSGSNLDFSSPNLTKNIEERIALLKKFDPDNNLPIPVDLVTASASGLDPEISVDAALYQVNRIAKFRDISKEKLLKIIKKYTSEKQLGIFGERRVNVLQVNLELDERI